MHSLKKDIKKCKHKWEVFSYDGYCKICYCKNCEKAKTVKIKRAFIKNKN